MGVFGKFKREKKNDGKLLILYGTKSGNAKLIAQQTQKYYRKLGLEPVCKNMAGYKPIKLKDINHLLVVVSTHGQGTPPPSATGFFEACMDDSMPSLSHLSYSVCALGDSSYDHFCWAGKILDKRFHELGAQCFSPRKDCDLEFSNDAVEWIQQSAAKFQDGNSKEKMVAITAPLIDVNKQFCAKIKTRMELTKGNNVTPVYHLVLDISDSDLKYSIGDSVVLQPKNPEWLVELLISEFAYGRIDESNVEIIKEMLFNELEITRISKSTVREVYEATKSESLKALLASGDQLKEFVSKANLYDLLKEFGLDISLPKLLTLLPRLKGRVYSIASSKSLFPNELHLTIKTIRYNFMDREHEGAGSVYANESLMPNTFVSFGLSGNEHFALPQDVNTPIIMIGVSTGIAPFRAILQERQAQNVLGNTWLLWGNMYKERDFLYEDDLSGFLEMGVLEKLNLAFSRDVEHKWYVQDELRANLECLIEWVGKGAHVFVCGSVAMGLAVKTALNDILAPNNISSNSLVGEGRYHEDVY